MDDRMICTFLSRVIFSLSNQLSSPHLSGSYSVVLESNQLRDERSPIVCRFYDTSSLLSSERKPVIVLSPRLTKPPICTQATQDAWQGRS